MATQDEINALSRACPPLQQAQLGTILTQFNEAWGDPVADIDGLKAIEPDQRVDRQVRSVETVGLYLFDAQSTRTEEQPLLVAPDTGTGIWRLIASYGGGFYLSPPAIDLLRDPPGTPDDGDRYVIDGAGTGDWVGHDNDIAEWSDEADAWIFTTPKEGCTLYVDALDVFRTWTGASWVNTPISPHAIANHSDVIIGTPKENNVLVLGVAGKWINIPFPFELGAEIAGTLAVGDDQARVVVPQAFAYYNVKKVMAFVKGKPVGSAITTEIQKSTDGISFSLVIGSANFQIADGAYRGQYTPPTPPQVQGGQILRFNLDQVGSGTPGDWIVYAVQLEATEAPV